jgi:hypothetical protein
MLYLYNNTNVLLYYSKMRSIEYYYYYDNDKDDLPLIDLTWVGNGSTTAADNDASSYVCEFCNIGLIEKKDDINDPRFGVEYRRFICPRCGNLKDRNGDDYDGNNSLKHKESFTPITDPSPYFDFVIYPNY